MLIERLLNTSALSGVMSVEGDPAPAAGGGAPPAAAPPAPWYQGADAEIIGHLQNRGLSDKTPAEAAIAMAKAHREAERFVGMPADQILRMPKDAADQAGWDTVYQRLGVPKDPKDYAFDPVKVGEVEVKYEGADADWLRQTAATLKLTKEGAATLAKSLAERGVTSDTNRAAERTAALNTEKATLDANWGQHKESNLFLAKQGAEKLGLDASTVTALESVVGYAKVMEALRKVGSAGAEAGFVANNGGGGGAAGITTREQAVARKSELMNDGAWGKRYMTGDPAAVREMTSLNIIISGESGVGYQPG